MTDEARLEELAKLLSRHPFLGMAVDDINTLEAQNAELRKRADHLENEALSLAGDLTQKEIEVGWHEMKNAELREKLETRSEEEAK